MPDLKHATETPEHLEVEEAQAAPKAPAPMTTGNAKIAIFKHDLSVRSLLDEYPVPDAIELAIRNVSESTIATAIFETVLYDEEGNILETVRHVETALGPETSRAIRIPYSPIHYNSVKSYGVRIVRTTTAHVEKVQLLRHELRTTETGKEEITGIAKNISRVITDAAVVADFFDLNKESIGTKVVILRDIEPNTARRYALSFQPQEGDTVATYTLRIAEIEG